MRIAYITAGAAGMYCGSCLHDNTLAAALLELGEDVLLCRPTRRCGPTSRTSASTACSSAASTSTCSRSVPLFRHTPWWFDRLLDHPALLERLSRRGGSVDPTQLGDLTVSMLRGEAGHQRKELEKLVALAAHRRASPTSCICRTRCRSAWRG